MPELRKRKAQSWIYYLRWDPKYHAWRQAKAIIDEPKRPAGWSNQPVKVESYWPPTPEDKGSSSPSSSSVGPQSPEPVISPCMWGSQGPAMVSDLIDSGSAYTLGMDDALHHLQAPMKPDKLKEYDLVSPLSYSLPFKLMIRLSSSTRPVPRNAAGVNFSRICTLVDERIYICRRSCFVEARPSMYATKRLRLACL